MPKSLRSGSCWTAQRKSSGSESSAARISTTTCTRASVSSTSSRSGTEKPATGAPRSGPRTRCREPSLGFFGERFSYVEEGTFDAEAERYDFRVITSAVTDRIRAKGTVTVEAVSAHQCERRVTLEIAADVLGSGD